MKDKYLLKYPPTILAGKPMIYRKHWEQQTKTALKEARRRNRGSNNMMALDKCDEY
jgi:hypothetical protein